MRRLVAAVTVMAGLCLFATNADAAQCSISTTPVIFGNYNVFASAPLDSLGAILLNCNGGAKAIAITIGPGNGGVFNPRKLFKSTEWLGYNLYRDASRAVVWGTGAGGTSFLSINDIPNKTDVSVPVYGQIAAGQDVSAGAYADSVSVTINF